MEVAYLAGAPDKAVMRIDFDNRGKTASTYHVILMGGISALLISSVVTFVLSWKFGWLSRKTA